MTLPTIELQFLIDNPSLHDSKGELCVESQEDDQTYLMSVPACSIPDTADVVKALATQRIADAKRIAELEAALTEARTESGPHITAAAERRLMTPEDRMAEVARIRAESNAFIARNMTPHSEGIAKGQNK